MDNRPIMDWFSYTLFIYQTKIAWNEQKMYDNMGW